MDAIATLNYAADANFTLAANAVGGVAISNTNIDTARAETSSYTTHKIFGGFGYLFRNWENPMLLGLGGHYEFADSNSEIENWTIYIKTGFAF